jgi:putative DNA-invertase from lambdoid prophage Rac
MHTFVYTRVSTHLQTADNQMLEIEKAGFEPDSIYEDVISGSVSQEDRPEWQKLIDAIRRTRGEKRLVVTKIDRLGRNAEQILSSVRLLKEMDCSVYVLQLSGLDLTSAAGKIVLATLSAVAEVELDMLKERTHAGLARARAEGKTLGRPKKITDDVAQSIRTALGEGQSISQIARDHDISRASVIRIREAA